MTGLGLWKRVALATLVDQPSDDIVDGPFGSRLKATEYVDSGIPIVRLQNVGRNKFVDKNIKFVTPQKAAEVGRHHFIAGDILISKLGNPLGEACIAPESIPYGILVADVVRVRPEKSRVDTAFLAYAINSASVAAQFEAETKGTTRPRVNLRKIRDLQIPLLESLAEQRLVVADIEKQFTRLEAGVAALRRVQANLKRYRAAVLKAACEGRLVPTEAELARRDGRSYETGDQLLVRILTERHQKWTGRGKYPEPVVPAASGLWALPDGWTWVTIGQLLTEPLCNGISVKGSEDPPGVRSLRLSAMSDSGFDYSDARYLPLSDADVDDLWIREGDFFISRGNGSLHLVGRGTPAQAPPQPTIFPDTMIRLRVAKEVRDTQWIVAIWPSRIVRSQVERKVKTTAGIYKIAQPQVEQIAVPLPPLAEQQRIVAEVERRLSVVDELESVVSANLQRATRLRQSILSRAFSGRLVSDTFRH